MLSGGPEGYSFFTAGSISRFASEAAPALPSATAQIGPSTTVQSLFLTTFTVPFSHGRSVSFSVSPSRSIGTFLRSVVPTPIFSHDSFAVYTMVVYVLPPLVVRRLLFRLILLLRRLLY